MSKTIKFKPDKEPERELKIPPKKPKGKKKLNKHQLLDLELNIFI